MRKIVLIMVGLLLSFMSLFIINACSKQGEVKANLNQQIRLPVGQTLVVNAEDLALKFVEVISDSRCPTGVQCVWAGEAKCQTTLTLKGVSSPLVLTVSGGSDSPTVFQGYTFKVNVEPYPQAGKTLDKASYIMVLTVIK